MLAAALLVPVAYALGMFPSAQLVARSKGVDITAAGSGNPGASNVGRVLGRRQGVYVFVLDGLKGAAAAAVGYGLAGLPGGLMLGIAAVVGHVFPITRGFRGGKGVATAGGSMIVLYPLISLGMCALWLVTSKISGKASIGSLALVVSFPITLVAVGRPIGEVLAVVGLAVLVAWRHLPNVRRLMSGTEPDISPTPR
ncbi:MAG: glycerol-3-phosphate acyltransferase [Actinomycetota bacterium]|nr:MAG: glycerol-3-phosphate acyltransferase [Actinomycetota bacterium]